MRRIGLSLLLLALTVGVVDDGFARGRRAVMHRGRHRTTVVVHRGFPLRRALPTVVIHPVRRAFRVAPAVFLAPVVWAPSIVVLPARDVIKWEDSETIDKEDEWSEFTLTAGERGTRLFLELQGEADFNFAEVVFDNGDAQVVDLGEKPRQSGVYLLLDFKDGRKVDHVRMVAKATTDEAKVILRMEK